MHRIHVIEPLAITGLIVCPLYNYAHNKRWDQMKLCNMIGKLDNRKYVQINIGNMHGRKVKEMTRGIILRGKSTLIIVGISERSLVKKYGRRETNDVSE